MAKGLGKGLGALMGDFAVETRSQKSLSDAPPAQGGAEPRPAP